MLLFSCWVINENLNSCLQLFISRYNCENFVTNSEAANFLFYNFETMEKYQCDICEKTLISKYVYTRHKKEQHINSKLDETNYCDICDKVFIDITNHKMSVHEVKRNFTCDICEKSFFFAKDLKKHYLSVHDKLKPYECDRCGKKFAQKLGIKTHITVNTLLVLGGNRA